MKRLIVAVGNEDLQLDDIDNVEKYCNKKVSKSFANGIYEMATSVKETVFNKSSCGC